MAQEFTFKRGLKKDAPKRVIEALKTCFGVDARLQDDECVVSYGALKKMRVRVGETLVVDTESKRDVPEEVAIDTNARFRCFLDKATGYTTKQRAKKAQEAAKRAADDD
ncbi:MAG TPA: DUF5611 family protein [Candidatus Acidoferrales bacterium]|jgi:hypothetical protein|nr:DUF5611 family protein [Candidatus Acidoferrales bacterium]